MKNNNIRTIILLIITLVLVMLMVISYVELYTKNLCFEYYKNNFAKIDTVEKFNDDDDQNIFKNNHDKRITSRIIKTGNKQELDADSEHKCSSTWNHNWDLKNSSSTKLTRGRSILLIRHGQYDFTSGKLTELGIKQARQTGIRLAEMGLSVVSMHHSTMIRAEETARIIHDSLNLSVPLTADPVLVEGGPAPPIPTIKYWSLPERDYHVDGPRLESAFRKYFYRLDDTDTRPHQTSHEIIVAHGNIIRFFVLRSLQLPIDSWMRMFIAHASITRVSIKHDGIVSMTLLGDSGHFKYSDVTY